MKKSYSWVVLIILAVGTAILYYSNMIFAVRAVDTLQKFQINEGQLAAIPTIGCLPGAFLSILVGRVLDQKGVKKFVALGLALTAACMVWRIFAKTYIELLIATVLIGVFLLPITIVGPKMVGGLFRPEQMPLAMGVFGAAGGLGTTLAFATGNVYSSLEAAFMGVSILGLVLLASWLLVVKEPAKPAEAAAEAPKGELSRVIKSANMWKVMFCSGFAVGASLLINTYLTQAFILEKGVEPGITYDVMTSPARSVEDLVAIAFGDENTRTMAFVKRFGLLGAAMEDEMSRPDAAEVPAELKSALACSGRPANYAAVFARDYREKTANISAWLDWITVLFNRSQSTHGGGMDEGEPFAALTLQTMLESAYKAMLADKTLHVCAHCKKVYYNEDVDSVVCCEDCERSHKDMEHYRWLKEKFQGHLVAGG